MINNRILSIDIIKISTSLFLVLGLTILQNKNYAQSCLVAVGDSINFTSTIQNHSDDYSTVYALTDYRGIILSSNNSAKVGSVNHPGAYKIYGINYFTLDSIQNFSFGDNIADIKGNCVDVSLPYDFVVCGNDDFPCSTFNGHFSFQSVGGNSNFSTNYVLTDLDFTIMKITPNPVFEHITFGNYLVFPINYDSIEGLYVGNNFNNISGICLDVGNPLFIKSCLPCLVTLGEDINLCTQASLVLTANAGLSGNYTWSTGQIGKYINVEPTLSQSYSVTFTSDEGCISIDSIQVNILGDPIANAGPNINICKGQQTNLQAHYVSGATYSWDTGEQTQNIKVSPISTRTYVLTVTVENCQAIDSVTVNVNETPIFNLNGNTEICNGESTTITAEGGVMYNWDNGSKTASITVKPRFTTTYVVTVTDGNGCTGSSNILVKVNTCNLCDIYDCNISCNECEGDINLNSYGGNELFNTVYVLTNDTGSIQAINSSPSFSNIGIGTWFVFGINYDPNTLYNGINIGGNVLHINGECLDIGEPYILKVCDNPIVSILGITDLCFGDSTTLTASGGTNYLWSSGNMTSSININPPINTTYSVTVTNEYGCLAELSKTVMVNSCGKIGNFVWEDLDGNGIQNINENGIANVEIILLKDGLQYQSTISDPLGMYMFSKLPFGDYKLLFGLPSGYIRTITGQGGSDNDSDPNQVNGLTSTITISENESELTFDAGYVRLSKIGDFVWEDSNNNGIQEINEYGIPMVSVMLNGVDGFGRPITLATQTDINGRYFFENLWPGNYVISFTTPSSSFRASPMENTFDDTIDSDINEDLNETNIINVQSGTINETIDAGFCRCAILGDYVWVDNGYISGIQDSSDIGIDGVDVYLYSTLNTTVAEQTTVTYTSKGKRGYYQFTVCNPGQYFVKVTKPELFDFVNANLGNGTNDSKITNFLSGTTEIFSINHGEIINTIDIGLTFKPLPITLINLSVVWDKNMDLNILNWSTLLEINNDYFDIERSIDSGEFETIGRIYGNGNSNINQNYSFIDKYIGINGIYTYRLRQVDFDGTTNYSKAINIQIDRYQVPSIKLYPNPTLNVSTLELKGIKNSAVELIITDSQGNLILEIIEDEQQIERIYQLDAIKFPNGIYYVMIRVDDKVIPLKWIILK